MRVELSASRRTLATLLAVLLPTVGCDRATKHLAEAALKGSAPRSFLGDVVRLHYAENRGAFLSLGAEWSSSARFWALTVPASLALLFVAIHVLRGGAAGLPALIAWSLILGGGLGNLWDRLLRQGRVTDFVSLGVGPVRTGVFNVADAALSIGVVFLLASTARSRSCARAAPK